MTARPAPEGFDRVRVADSKGIPTRRLKCQRCGALIVPSGLGVGSHRRKHDREEKGEVR